MQLNAKQKEAVEYLGGPLLVLAGPGTGKTQLLSQKVVYILKETDTNPENILCLTFTESGATNMYKRLQSLIGRDGLRVNIGTYHAFGAEVLTKYKNYAPDYTRRLDAAIDEVTQFKIVKKLRDELPARDILRGDNVKDIISVISEAKGARLEARDLALIAERNIEQSRAISDMATLYLEKIVPRVFKASYEQAYLPIYEVLKKYENEQFLLPGVESQIGAIARDLKAAINEAEESGKIRPLSAWKDKYFEKDGKGAYRLSDRVANLKLASIAVVMREYQKYLTENGLYDFDDMIEEAGRVLREDEGFRLTMQERYQYVMLDEFQDTNPSQLEIVKLITDYEKPQIMAVGDDDQAIYEFQGASATNLTEFQNHYGANVVVLTENYRSTQEILDFSHRVIKQVPESERFGDKVLSANRPDLAESGIRRVEFLSSDQEYGFVAGEIARLVQAGVSQNEIAVISYKTKYFMPLLPYLKAHPEIKIAYEKRDDLFEDDLMGQFFTMMRLVHEVSSGGRVTVSMLEVLAYPYFDLPMIEVVRLAGAARAAHEGMFEYMLKSPDASEGVKAVVEFFAELAALALTQPLERVTAELISKMRVDELEPYERFRFYENLASMKGRLSRHFGEKNLRVADFVQLLDDYTEAEMPLTVVSPYRDAEEAVSLLSAHKAKGLEFEHVFLLSVDHTAWGKGKGNNNMLALPKNLMQIRHTGMTDGERLRILYVALSRAKTHLTITNSLHDFLGKSPERLEYLDERVVKLEDGTEAVESPLIPSGRVVLDYDGPDTGADDFSGLMRSIEGLSRWVLPYVKATPDMRAIYTEQLNGWRMSPTALTSFIDIVNAGPVEFFRRQILHAEYEPADESLVAGTLMHAVFEKVTREGISDEEAVRFFLDELEKCDLPAEDKSGLRERGPEELLVALREFSEVLRDGEAEVGFGSEHLVIDGVPVTGTIDHLAIDEAAKTIEIYDFKTGGYHKEKWQSHATLYKYMIQLVFYKMLLAASPKYARYRVERAHILFVKPDKKDGLVYDRVYEFNEEDEKLVRDLMVAVYRLVTSLKFMEDPELFVPKDDKLGLKDIKNFVEIILEKRLGRKT